MHEEKQVIELRNKLEEKEREVKKYKKQIAMLLLKITRQQEQNTKEKVKLKIQYNVAKRKTKKEFKDTIVNFKFQLNAKDTKNAELTTILFETLGNTNAPSTVEKHEQLEFEKENEKLNKEAIKKTNELKRLTEEVTILELNFKTEIIKTSKLQSEKDKLNALSMKRFKELNKKIEYLTFQLNGKHLLNKFVESGL